MKITNSNDGVRRGALNVGFRVSRADLVAYLTYCVTNNYEYDCGLRNFDETVKHLGFTKPGFLKALRWDLYLTGHVLLEFKVYEGGYCTHGSVPWDKAALRAEAYIDRWFPDLA